MFFEQNLETQTKIPEILTKNLENQIQILLDLEFKFKSNTNLKFLFFFVWIWGFLFGFPGFVKKQKTIIVWISRFFVWIS
jgi:hypothetical protein